MANPHNPVTVVTGGGNFVTPVTDGCNPATIVTGGGNLITLTDSGMNPMTLSGGVFSLDLSDGIVDPGYTFTRATVATVKDWEGILRNSVSGEIRMQGFRRVDNLLAGPTDTLSTESVTVIVGRTYLLSFEGTGSITLSGAAVDTLAGSSGQRKVFDAITASTTTLTVTVTGVITNALLEDITGQANTNPSEYVSSGEGDEHGTNVDNVKYFTYENGNTVASNVVTTATGAALTTIRGAVIETQTTNLIDDGEDFNSSWTATSITLSSSNTVAPDGEADAQEWSDSSGAGANVFSPAMTVTAGTVYCASIYVKKQSDSRVNALGVMIAQPSYAHWATVTLNATTGETGLATTGTEIGLDPEYTTNVIDEGDYWRLVIFFATVTLTSVDMHVYPAFAVTSNLDVYNSNAQGTQVFWGAQVEVGKLPTTYVPGTARNADVLTYPATEFPANNFTVISEHFPIWDYYRPRTSHPVIWGSGATDDFLALRTSASSRNIVGKFIVSASNDEDVTPSDTDFFAGDSVRLAYIKSSSSGLEVIARGVSDGGEVTLTGGAPWGSTIQIGGLDGVVEPGQGYWHVSSPLKEVTIYPYAMTVKQAVLETRPDTFTDADIITDPTGGLGISDPSDEQYIEDV